MAKVISYSIVLDEYPKTCDECPFLTKHAYKDNAYSGTYYQCDLGYMNTGDTREFAIAKKRWDFCSIESNPNVDLT